MQCIKWEERINDLLLLLLYYYILNSWKKTFATSVEVSKWVELKVDQFKQGKSNWEKLGSFISK
jgi:hypothetical protein